MPATSPAITRCLLAREAYHTRHDARKRRPNLDARRHNADRTGRLRSLVTPVGPAQLFAQSVGRQMTDGSAGVLRYTARLQLLREAQQHGIDRFDANLLIAAVQHRNAKRARAAAQQRPRARRYSTIASGAAMFLTIELMLVACGWLMLA
jgi:hypothetical protein